MTDNPCNCESCQDVSCPYNPPTQWSEKSVDNEMREVWEATKRKGCLSHPRSREVLMNGVVEELENLLEQSKGAYMVKGEHEQKYWFREINKILAHIRGEE